MARNHGERGIQSFGAALRISEHLPLWQHARLQREALAPHAAGLQSFFNGALQAASGSQ
jgi:hypothetical protein